jgi:hypothetical protein
MTTLVVVECSKVRQFERKEEMRACPVTTNTYLVKHRTSLLVPVIVAICGPICARAPKLKLPNELEPTRASDWPHIATYPATERDQGSDCFRMARYAGLSISGLFGWAGIADEDVLSGGGLGKCWDRSEQDD